MSMAKPEPEEQVPTLLLNEYERWRLRVLGWPAPIEGAEGMTVADMPEEWQARLIDQLLVAKALRSKPGHWSRALVDLGDE